MKNRNGKPTAFQRQALRDLGDETSYKTYRAAENAIKRLQRAAAKAKGQRPVLCRERDLARPAAVPRRVLIGNLVTKLVVPVYVEVP